jgi:hypothetical protein
LLLLEHLTHLRSGDQVIGLSTQETLAMIQRMPAIHAEFWQDPGLHEHSWLPDPCFWFTTLDPELGDDFFVTVLNGNVLSQRS